MEFSLSAPLNLVNGSETNAFKLYAELFQSMVDIALIK